MFEYVLEYIDFLFFIFISSGAHGMIIVGGFHSCRKREIETDTLYYKNI